jgi:diguanylate cyclase (GGDEF)-like protein/PAS domain S-box-containing protein
MNFPGHPALALDYREIFERSIVGVAVARLDGTFISANLAFARIFGYDAPAAFIAAVPNVESLYADPDARRQMLQVLEREGVVRDFEARMRRRDGELRWISGSLVALKPADGAPGLIQAAVIDGTNKRRSHEREQALLSLEHQVTVRFSQARDPSEALKAAMQAICETERWEAARYVYVDEARGVLRAGESWSIPDPKRERYLRESLTMEYAPGVGLLGHVWKTGEPLWVPDIGNDPRVARPQFAAETGMRGSVVFPVHADGKTIGVLIFDSREVRKPDERLLRTLAVIGGQIGQLMRRAQAEQALAARERRFRALIEHGHDAMVLYDRELRMVYRSPTAKGITGYEDQERLGGPLLDLVFEDDQPAVQTIVDHLLDQGGSAPFSCRVLHKSGRLRWIEGVFTNLLDEPAVGALVVNYRDIDEQVRAREALERSERYFRSLIESSGDIIAVADLDWRFTYMNPGLTRILGYEPRHAIGRLFLDYTPCDANALRAEVALALDRPAATHVMQLEARHRDGSTRTLETTIVRSVDAANMPVYLINSRDLSERRRGEARLRKIVEATAAPLLLVDPGGTIVFANPAAAFLFGRPAAALQGSPLGLPVNDARPAEVQIPQPDGARRAAEMQFAAAELEGREVLVVSLHDLTERKRYESRIEHLASHDALTGLPNRALLRDRVEQAIVHARRTSSRVAVMYVDLDQFKLVNDSWGHPAGDALLVEVGNRLRSAMRDGDTVARLGGDEFVVLLADLARPGDSAVVARKIAGALGPPIVLDGRETQVTASIGIAIWPEDGEGLEALLQCADVAMYRAKDEGRNGYQYYSGEMGAQARARVELETGLRQALERAELRLHWQPQVDLASGEVRGCEALMRWERPGRGLVSPAQFIPLAEESGLIVPIGEWALRTACREAAGWAAAGLGRIQVAVNLSARQFRQGSVVETVRAALAESGLPPGSLELEITESVVARDLDQVVKALEQVRRMGVSVAIDDFGTGYSSLSYLRTLPIQKVKIDRSFIKGIPEDREAAALVGEIIRLAHVLSLEVVAEGVETAPQAAFLREAGCEKMQGFLFSRPVPSAEFAALVRSGARLVLP